MEQYTAKQCLTEYIRGREEYRNPANRGRAYDLSREIIVWGTRYYVVTGQWIYGDKQAARLLRACL